MYIFIVPIFAVINLLHLISLTVNSCPLKHMYITSFNTLWGRAGVRGGGAGVRGGGDMVVLQYSGLLPHDCQCSHGDNEIAQ